MNHAIQLILFSLVIIATLRCLGHDWYRKGKNSGELIDIYTWSHFLHGVIFYWLYLPYSIALFLETVWEIFENSPFIIKRYRKAGHSDYHGDAVWNSVMDLGVCALGWLLASQFSLTVSITTVILVEVLMYLAVKDNLLLNILALVGLGKKQ